MAEVNIKKDIFGRIIVSFYYDPLLVAKIKTIDGRKWHPVEKHWSFPPPYPPHRWGRERVGVKKLESGLSPKFAFEDLRRELVSRKYSYKTVKGYIYYNGDFLNFTDKEPSEVNDDDIKDYLLYLAEGKESATATINQAINALKFYPALLYKCGVYYGAMLKRKFLYEVKRPRKDKKLPEVLSKPR